MFFVALHGQFIQVLIHTVVDADTESPKFATILNQTVGMAKNVLIIFGFLCIVDHKNGTVAASLQLLKPS